METRRFILHLFLGTTATLIIFLTSLEVPLVGVLTVILTPFPIMVLCCLWGLRAGMLAALVGAFLISTVLSLLLGIVFFIEFGLLGILLYHHVARRGLRWDYGIALASLTVVAIMALFVIAHGVTSPSNLIDWLRAEILETSRSISQLYPLEKGRDQPLWIASREFADFVLRILPAFIILTIWLEGIVNISLLARLMRRRVSGTDTVVMRPEFCVWACPDRLVWAGILGGFMIITKISPLVTVGSNAVILLVAIYFLQGLAVVSFFFKKNNVPVGFRVLGYSLIGIIQVLWFVVAAIGLFDIWIDFRRLRPRVTAYKETR